MHPRAEEQVEKRPDAIAVVCEGRGQLQRTQRPGQSASLVLQAPRGRTGNSNWRIPGAKYRNDGDGPCRPESRATVPLDPSYPSERLAFMVEDSKAEDSQPDENAGNIGASGGQADLLNEESEIIYGQSSENVKAEVTAGNMAYLIYTSGSTGRPKGVVDYIEAPRIEWNGCGRNIGSRKGTCVARRQL